MKFLKLFVFIGILSILPSWAKEGGDQYPHGGEKWYVGAIPPPGTYYINYFGYYSGKLKNGSGANASVNGSIPEVDATFDAFRFVQVTKWKVLGGNYAAHVIVPVVHQSMNLNGRAAETAVGDITVNPLIVGWHHPSWHAVAAFDVFLPSGHYNKTDGRRSIGANYVGFEPLMAVSYLPKSGWEASAKVMYDFKSANNATNYKSGQEFHTDYAAGKHIGSWVIGGTGYWLQQTTNDLSAGKIAPAAAGVWDAGRKGQVVAVGPSVGYQSKNHMIFMADWQHETLVRNRFGGDKFWFKMIIPVSSLLPKKTKQ